MSVRVRQKHAPETPLSSLARKGKLGMGPRWKLQCASTGALIITGIQNMPLHVAADMSRCNAFFFFFIMLLENKKNSYRHLMGETKDQCGVIYLLDLHKYVFFKLLG